MESFTVTVEAHQFMRHHVVRCSGVNVGAVLVSTRISNGEETTTHSAHHHPALRPGPMHTMLLTPLAASFDECLQAVIGAVAIDVAACAAADAAVEVTP